MTVVAQLGIGARAKMQMAATGDRGFRLAAISRGVVRSSCTRLGTASLWATANTRIAQLRPL